MRFVFLNALALLVVIQAAASDWPQFLGPRRNGVYDGPAIGSNWEKSEPKIIWKKKVGQGFAGPAVADGKLILFHRIDNDEILSCFNAETGAVLWEAKYPTTYRDDFGFDEGPRATPCIQDGRVYSFGAEGMIQCVDFQDGKKVWAVNSKKDFRAGKGFFGMACSPLVVGESVLLNIGGENGAGIVALDKNTGKLRWKATDHEASYSSPVSATFEERNYALFFTRNGLVALDPLTGKTVVDFPWRSRMNASVNAATPLVIDNFIFLSASYGTGAILLEWKEGRVKKVWAGDDVLSNHYASAVYYDGYLYGFDGRQESGPSLTCVQLKTGKAQWRQDGFGAGTVTRAGNELLILKEDGELLLAAASPKKFEVSGRTQILGSTARAYPAIANQRIFARDKSQLVCVSLP
jgi:outer membrane protein assembly factor BamB